MKYLKFLPVIILSLIIFYNCQPADESKPKERTQLKWSSELKINASDAADYDYFGDSVSMSGDYLIIGAPFENGIGSLRGAAYVFHRTGTNSWDSGTKITASDAADNDYFGTSVSISGDYAIVGAYCEDGIGTDRGAAYIFHRTGTNIWDSGIKITASDGADTDAFGISVSISGDYAIAGAFREDGAGTDRGAAYIFHRTGTNTWSAGTKITASDGADNDSFGISVSISGDYAVAGSTLSDTGAISSGAAYSFHRTGTNTWEAGTKLIASDPEGGDNFGCSVSISGDYTIIGAQYKDGAGTRRGAAYIYHRYNTNSWDFIAKLTPPNPEDSSEFGNSVSISGDNVIVGADYEDCGGVNRGAAYIYHNRTATNAWDFVLKLSPSEKENGDFFGTSVSISGDYAAVGAFQKDCGGTDRGRVYIYK